MDRIPSKQLYPGLVIADFYSNVRSVKMRQKLSVHVVSTLEELWERADRCARYEEGRDHSPPSRWSKVRTQDVPATVMLVAKVMYPEALDYFSSVLVMNKR